MAVEAAEVFLDFEHATVILDSSLVDVALMVARQRAEDGL